MRGNPADGVPTPDPGSLCSLPDGMAALPDGTTVPDPDVVDNARSRLASRYPASDAADLGQIPARPMDDAWAVHSVIAAARSGAERPADALDVGAGLVMLGNLRHYLDRLEADLLDAAEHVDLNWDVIAAIIGIPAEEAQNRHSALRARRQAQ
jgi:hypothetical protein